MLSRALQTLSPVRQAAHPATHPLRPLLKRTAATFVKRHCSPLHYLCHSFSIVHSQLPSQASIPPCLIDIARDRETAIAGHDEKSELDAIRIYTDGSRIDGGIGAAAVLYRKTRNGSSPRTLRYHLGSESDYTVYEAEAVGLTLAARLLLSEKNPVAPISIFVDNQAAIRCGDRSAPKFGHYIVKQLCEQMQVIYCKHNLTRNDVTIRWAPGHEGIPGNEKADEEARKAAQGSFNNSASRRLPIFLRNEPLPTGSSLQLLNEPNAAEHRPHLS